jgi:hypothetical protein
MTDQSEREEESLDSDESQYERDLEEEARRRHEAAERLKRDPLPAPLDE